MQIALVLGQDCITNGVTYKTCDFTDWFPWGPCSNPCGVGVRDRWKGACCPKNITMDYFECLKFCKLSTKAARIPNVTCAEMSKCPSSKFYCYFHIELFRSSGGRVVELLACGARGPGFDSRPRHSNFQRLVISCFQVEIWLKYR